MTTKKLSHADACIESAVYGTCRHSEPGRCRECGNTSYHQRDCSKSNYETTGNDTIVRGEDREDN